MKNYSAIEKLKMDVLRFKGDQSLGCGWVETLKLIFVVDFWPVLWFRLMEHSMEQRTYLRKMFRLFIVLLRPLVEGFSGARLRPGAQVGGGLLLHHSVGVVIAAEAEIGSNCTLFAGACIVHKANGKGAGAPLLRDGVSVMSGAKVIGRTVVGKDSIVGANAVVIEDVPEGSVAVGIPARAIKKDCDVI